MIHTPSYLTVLFPIARFGCRRGIKHRSGHSCSRHRGAGVPPCDLENLADAIKMIMRECEKAGLFCELQEGTLLGRYTAGELREGSHLGKEEWGKSS